MRKLVAVLFGLLVVTAGLAAARQWEVTSVHQRHDGEYGWAYAEVGVQYDVQRPYTHYQITYKYGNGGLNDKYRRQMLLTGNPYVLVSKETDSYGITVTTKAYYDFVNVETVIASAGWPL